MVSKFKLNILSAFMAGLIASVSALIGAVTQMLNDGFTSTSDIAGLVWLVTFLSFLLGFGKDFQTYLKRNTSNDHSHTHSSDAL